MKYLFLFEDGSMWMGEDITEEEVEMWRGGMLDIIDTDAKAELWESYRGHHRWKPIQARQGTEWLEKADGK